jgi:hypothetical protein
VKEKTRKQYGKNAQNAKVLRAVFSFAEKIFPRRLNLPKKG